MVYNTFGVFKKNFYAITMTVEQAIFLRTDHTIL